MRIFMAMVDDEIEDIGNPLESIGENKNGIAFVKKRVTEEKQRAGETEPPEHSRDNHAFEFFSGVPLDDETRKKPRIAGPADHLPNSPFDPEQTSIVPEQI